MSRVVHHYPVTTTLQTLEVPCGSEIVGAILRQGTPTIYVEKKGNPEAPPAILEFLLVRTGQEVPLPTLRHIAIVQHGAFVWHVYGRIIYG